MWLWFGLLAEFKFTFKSCLEFNKVKSARNTATLQMSRQIRQRNLLALGLLALVTFSLVLSIVFVIRTLISERHDPVNLQNPVRSSIKDLVKWLPGAKFKPNFKHYSGYLRAGDNHNLHYWLVESQSEPSKDPLVLWLNGGPGCSSLLGLFTEIGPFRVTGEVEFSVRENPFAWNKRANVIFMESPVGVGFSYSLNNSFNWNDNTTAEQNYKALKSFYEKFPHFKNRSLYLTGESYASVYLSTLALLLDQDQEINLKGVAIGNGCFDSLKLKESLVYYGHFHGLPEKGTWNEFRRFCCDNQVHSKQRSRYWQLEHCCQFIERTVDMILESGLNPSKMFDKCRYHSLANESIRASLAGATRYLRQPDVLVALHVPVGLQRFSACNQSVKMNYAKLHQIKGQILRLLESPRELRLLVYSGDTDLQCNFMGDDWFVQDLKRAQIKTHSPWHLNNQEVGFVKVYRGVTFATVTGSGQMVAVDRPAEALHLFHSLIDDQQLD